MALRLAMASRSRPKISDPLLPPLTAQHAGRSPFSLSKAVGSFASYERAPRRA